MDSTEPSSSASSSEGPSAPEGSSDAADRPPSPGVGPDSGGADSCDSALTVVVQDPERRLSGEQLERLQTRAHAAIAQAGGVGEITIRVIGDEAMTTAHERFIGLREPTDVLTFDFRDDPDSGAPLETDVLVCLDEAERRAAETNNETGHDAGRELLLYALHGALHCLGYNDTDEEAAARMHAREDEILEAIGVGRVFQAGAGIGRAAGEGAQ